MLPGRKSLKVRFRMMWLKLRLHFSISITALYYERQMKQVYLEIVNQDSCNASIRGAERKVPYLLTDDMFCAGGGLGHDACSVSYCLFPGSESVNS